MRTKATIFSFLLTVALYFAYGWGLVPLVLPNPTAGNAKPSNLPIALDNTRLEIEPFLALFPENGWERDPKKDIHYLQFGQIILLFGKDIIDGQFVRLEPCTVLLLPDSQEFLANEESQDRLRQTVVLRTQEYAELQFDRDFDISKTPLPQIVNGHLTGKVAIQSDMNSPGKHDDLFIEAEGVAFAETASTMEIKTLKDVHFVLGYHQGTGTNLTFEISMPSADQPSANRELNRLVFQKLKSLHLVFPEETNIQPKLVAGTYIPDGAASLIDVYCKGRFEFAANPAEEGWTASFYQDVTMTRNNPDKTVDKLTAEEVHLTIKPKDPQPGIIVANGKTSQFENLDPALFVARGKRGQGNQPPVPARLATKQSGDITLVGDEIFLDVRKSFLSLSTRQGAGASPSVEMILAGQYTVKSEHCIQYTFNKTGSLGKFVSEGKGSLTGKAGEGSSAKNFHLTWNEMQMEPHPAIKEQNVLKLGKGISAQMAGIGTMTADTLDLIFSLPSSQQSLAKTPNSDNQKSSLSNSNLLLDHALIKNNVLFETASGSCRVGQLTIFFTNIIDGKALQSRWSPHVLAVQPPEVPRVGMAATQSIQQVQYLAPLAPMQPVYQPLATVAPAYGSRIPISHQPAATKPTGHVETQNLLGIKSSPSGGKFEITGTQMRMEVIVQNGQSSANIVAIEGNVRLKENEANKTANSAIEIIGDTVTIWNPADPTTQINIKGQAASTDAIFKGKGVELRARELNLSRLHNTFWSPGAGQLIAQTAGLNTQGIPTSSNANNDKLFVEWNKEMRCDGKVLQFIGLPGGSGNRVHVVHQTQAVWCNEMEIQLNRQVMFFDDQSSIEPKATVIRCSQDVYVRNEQVDIQKKRKSIDTARVVNLQYDVDKNYLAAEGPGEMNSIFIGSGQGFDPKASVTVKSTDGSKLNFLGVWFRDKIQGTLLGNNKMVNIIGRVQAAYCPVSGWNDIIAQENLSAARRTGYTLECEQLNVAEMPNPSDLSQSSMELTASDDAIIEGSGIYGKAQTIKYNQGKSIVNMDGNVSLSAQGQTSIRDVQSVQYNIETNSINFAQLKGLGIGQ